MLNINRPEVSAIKFIILATFTFSHFKLAFSRESVWGLRMTNENVGFNVMPNYMYEDSFITVSGSCESEEKDEVFVEFQWILLEIECMAEMYKTTTRGVGGMFSLLSHQSTAGLRGNVTGWNERQAVSINGSDDKSVTFFVQFSQRKPVSCRNKQLIKLEDESTKVYFEATGTEDAIYKVTRDDFHVRREISRKNNTRMVYNRVATAWSDGMYHFFISAIPVGNFSFTANVVVEMRGHYGYLSAIEWPALLIKGVMSLLYLMAASVWIFMWARAQDHSQRIHIVIGVVAVAGAMGNTLVFIDLSIRNTDGIGAASAQWIGKFISILQLGLTQLLLMIVSTGYGINRPTISRFYIRLMASFSAMSFIVNCALSIVLSESLKIKYEQPWLVTLVVIIYSSVMLIVAGWIMVFSIYTFIYLFQRRHSSQRKLFIFSVYVACCITAFTVYIVSSVYTLVSNGLFAECLKNWKNEWLLETVGQCQMFGLLMVLMWLWKPLEEPSSSDRYHPLSIEENGTEQNSDEDEKNTEHIVKESLKL